MKTNQTFSILFWLSKSKVRNGKAPIYCRISVNGVRTEIATKRSVEISKWNSSAGNLKGNSEEARTINTYLSMMRTEILNHYNLLVAKSEHVTVDKLKNALLGIKEEQKTLLGVIKFHNEKMLDRVKIDISKSTYTKFETIRKKLEAFLKKQYHVKDILIVDLKNKFVVDFEHYLRVEEKIGLNTCTKYIRSLKKIMNLCVANEWLIKNPFDNFKCTTVSTVREVLTLEELIQLENKEIEIERLNEVRDVFLFCCYTGFAFIDVFQLTEKELTTGIDGNKWIFTNRQKTGNQSNVPLLPQALRILEKYKSHPVREITGKLFPVKSNQKMNAYLKEIGTLCKFDKNLTMHLARHTFATTVTLSNGVPIETVSKMLGHTKLATTQIYAKVLEQKVSQDMSILMEKMQQLEEVTKNEVLKMTV
jgi:site-specific recombinase XerD